MQIDAEARIEGALDHALAVHFEHARRREAAHQRGAHPFRVGSGAAGEQQRFGHRFDVQRDDDLVGDLGRLPGAAGADQRDVATHALEQRAHAREGLVAAAAHDGQRRRLGADFAAGHRRVDVIGAQRLDARGEVLGLQRGDRAHVDDDLARAQALRDAVVAEQHAFDVGRVGQHQEHDVGALGDFARAGAGLRAGVEQRRRHAAARMRVQRGVRGQQVARHRRAHDSQSDESDVLHCLLLVQSVNVRRASSPGRRWSSCSACIRNRSTPRSRCGPGAGTGRGS
ncbi:hypothetical protein GALL_355820 [mine drainage metagenome]|uniref:Uncharacterized protein n=1 Tax=mine drainage metagenome TaxID=410659 RepID=A0A1J5QH91_9ZZZZ